jgi:hypothetical protein
MNYWKPIRISKSTLWDAQGKRHPSMYRGWVQIGNCDRQLKRKFTDPQDAFEYALRVERRMNGAIGGG